MIIKAYCVDENRYMEDITDEEAYLRYADKKKRTVFSIENNKMYAELIGLSIIEYGPKDS